MEHGEILALHELLETKEQFRLVSSSCNSSYMISFVCVLLNISTKSQCSHLFGGLQRFLCLYYVCMYVFIQFSEFHHGVEPIQHYD